MPKATTKKPGEKPKPPWEPFPLFFHQTGQWSKKIRGKTHYFGTDAEAAEKRYSEVKDDLHAGRVPRPKTEGGGIQLRDLVNHFLTFKSRKVTEGELDGRTYGEYYGAAERLVAFFKPERLLTDFQPTDFNPYRSELAKRFGPASLSREITMARMIFKYGFDNALIPLPTKFGTGFSKPGKKTMRKDRNAKVGRTLEAVQIRKLLKLANPQLRAMILLAVNVGYGNYDVATLPLSAIDLKKSIADYARPKTGVERRAPLWPETMDALKVVIASRPKLSDPAADKLLFITKYGKAWVRQEQTAAEALAAGEAMKMVRKDAVAGEFTKLLKLAGIKRAGVGFYSLRATHRTVTDSVPDRAAVDRVMGHEPNSMASYYVEWKRTPAEDLRVKKVTDHVRAWLFPRAAKK